MVEEKHFDVDGALDCVLAVAVTRPLQCARWKGTGYMRGLHSAQVTCRATGVAQCSHLRKHVLHV